MPPHHPNAISRALEPLAAVLWVGFIVWTILTAALWISGAGDAQVDEWIKQSFHTEMQRAQGHRSPLQGAAHVVLHLVDPLWIMLGALVVYAHTGRVEGSNVARKWAGWILLAGFLVMLLSTWTALPLGPIYYTGRLNPDPSYSFGPVSVGAIFLWPLIVLGARELARLLLRRSSPVQVAGLSGLIAAGTALNLEPVATKLRAFWLWNVGQPGMNQGQWWQIGLTWFVVTTALVFGLRQPQVARTRFVGTPQAAITLVLLNILCLTTWLRWR